MNAPIHAVAQYILAAGENGGPGTETGSTTVTAWLTTTLTNLNGLVGLVFALLVFVMIVKTIAKGGLSIVSGIVAIGGAILVWALYANIGTIAGTIGDTLKRFNGI